MNKYQEAMDYYWRLYNKGNLYGDTSKEWLEVLQELVDKTDSFKKKQETNFEHFKEDIVNLFIDNLSVVHGKPNRCICTVCDERCDIRANCDDETHHELVKAWLRSPYKKPTYKLNRFEYDLLNTFDRCKECCLLNEIECLKKLSGKGYFKGIDPFTKVHDIIDNCEVIK